MRLPGTNQQQVNGIINLIQGVALNYPPGLKALRHALNQVDPPAPIEIEDTGYQVPSPLNPTPQWEPPQPIPTQATPLAQQAFKRGPGRPPGSKNKR